MSAGQTQNDALRKSGLSAETRAAILSIGDDVGKLEKSHQKHVRAAEEVSDLYAKLSAKIREVYALSKGAQSSGVRDKLLAAIREMWELQQRCDEQFHALQKEMQESGRQYGMFYNALKVRHDTIMTVINNLR